MLKFTKSLPYLPDPARPRPLITEQERAWAAGQPPLPVPFHCKPWVDGQTIGWTLFYGYRTSINLHGRDDGRLEIENLALLVQETGREDTVVLENGRLCLQTGYAVTTPAGLMTLLIPPTHPLPGLLLEPAAPVNSQANRPVSLAFRLPATGPIDLTFNAQTELARIVVVVANDGQPAQPLAGAELAALRQRETAYRAEEQTTPTRWTAATGDSFTHLYRTWSRRNTRRA